MNYQASNWYWQIPGISGQVFSSQSANLVSVTDSGYEAWRAAGNLPSVIGGNAGLSTAAAFAELYDVLTAQAPTVAKSVAAAWFAASYLTPAQGLAVMFANGVIITSTGTPAVNGTYGIDPTNQAKIAFVSSYITLHSAFPNSYSTLTHLDLSGNPHVFPTTTLFQAFATAVADFVTAVDEAYIAGSAWPSNAKTIA